MPPKPPPELTSAYLRDQARRHLVRFEPTVFQMRRVLMRRVDRCIEFHGGSRAEGRALVEGVLRDLEERGWLDDERVARGWVETLHRRGNSRRAMRAKLREKGLHQELVERCIAELGDDPDEAAALAYARRRRLGLFRTTGRAERRERDLAAMARAGFSFGVCQRVIDAEDLE